MNTNSLERPATEHFREDNNWVGLEFPVLSVEELARQQANVEDSVHQNRGIWWRRARPFFWQPCFSYQAIDPKLAWPSPLRSLAGYTHLTNTQSESNGVFRAVVHEDLPRYSVNRLKLERRNRVRKGLRQLEVRIATADEMLRDGYNVYVSCHTRVNWGRNKCSRGRYAAWMNKVLQQPKRLILGAFYKNRLVAFALPNACSGILCLSYIASHSDFLKMYPNDVLYHAFLTIGRQSPALTMAEFGTVSSKPSLDNFKLGYGRVKEFPSFTWINPAIKPFLMNRIHQRYPWLQASPSTASCPSLLRNSMPPGDLETVLAYQATEDLTNANMDTILRTSIISMSIAQMVETDSAAGEKLHLAGSTWWREVKPFFYQPADIGALISPGFARPSPLRALGGYYHMTPGPSGANGMIVVNEIRAPQKFTLSMVRKTKRNMIRRGLQRLRIAMVDAEVLESEGYQIYLDWEKRTSNVRVKRSDSKIYRRWVKNITSNPFNLILGAFYQNQLVAWVVARAVEGRADLCKAFSHSAFHRLEPTSTLIYAYILICGQNTQITSACDGLKSMKSSLEEYKAALGFQQITYPAYIHLNPLAKVIARRLFPFEYDRLMGQYTL